MDFYGFVDLFTTSYAESMRNTYKKVVSRLETIIEDYDRIYGYMYECSGDIHTALNGYGDASCGKMISTFENKHTDNQMGFGEVFATMQDARDKLPSKLELARSKLAYYQNLVEEEDRRKREYQEGEI